DILTEKENVTIKSLLGHGGMFKTKIVSQKLMAAALNTPVSVMESSAAEGGAWGIALLAAFMLQKTNGCGSLEQFMEEKVFINIKSEKIEPDPEDVKSFNNYLERYTAGLIIEKTAAENFKK
nr:FGGY-family carbohydrate kinase [Treponema sp.]